MARSRNKVALKSISLVVLLVGLVAGVVLVGKIQLFSQKAYDEIFFSDDFERTSVPSPTPTVGSWSANPNWDNITTSTTLKRSGTKSLKVQSSGSLVAAIYDFGSDKTGSFSVYVYDDGSTGSEGSLISIANADVSQYLILIIAHGQPNYRYRVGADDFDSGVPRQSNSWVKFEFVVTPSGGYGKINGFPLSGTKLNCGGDPNVCKTGINFNLKTARKISLGRNYYSGSSYFDDMELRDMFQVPSSIQQRFDNWTDKSYSIYGNTDVSGLINSISSRSPGPSNGYPGKAHENTMAIRLLMGKAMLYSYNGISDPVQDSYAINLINSAVDKYQYWGKAWLSSVAMNQLAFEAWWHWNALSDGTKAKLYDILSQEADFWRSVRDEVKNDPNGYTISIDVRGYKGEGQQRKNSEVMIWNDYNYDTKAEESSSVAQVSSTARSMLKLNGTSERWETSGNTWAFHSLTRDPGESFGEITSKTIASDYKVSNHNVSPNPGYALAGLTGLQQSELNFELADLALPSQYRHNINVANPLVSPGVWYKNIAQCMDSNYEITVACNKGKDWGDTNMRLATFILPYWWKLNNGSGTQTLLSNMTTAFYRLHKDNLRIPVRSAVSSVSSMNQTAIDMVVNLETHPQTSLKFYTLDHLTDQNFRNAHLPNTVRVCEDDIFKKKVWYGNLNWSCPSDVKKIGTESLKLTNADFADAEVYSPLIKVDPSTGYTIRYWVKANLVKATSPNDAKVYGRVVAAEYNTYVKESYEVNDATRVKSGFDYGPNYNTNSWSYKSYNFTTTSDTQYIRLRVPLGLNGRASGTVYFDAIEILPTGGNPIPF